MKLLRNEFLLLIGIPLVCTLLMIGVYALPLTPIIHHVDQSTDAVNERVLDHWAGETHFTTIANGTDILMVDTAIYPSSKDTIIKDAMLNPYIVPENSNGDLYDIQNVIHKDMIGIQYHIETYGRFWNGFLLWLKPLLLVFDLNEIKILNMFVQIALFTTVILLLKERFNNRLCIAFAVSYAALNPITNILSFQSGLMTITLVTIIILIQMEDWLNRDSHYIYLFTLAGMATSFFAYMTYPLITLGIPLVIFILQNKEKKLTELLNLTILVSIFWTIGYGWLWASKWLIGSVLSGENILSNAINQAAFRTSGETEEIFTGTSFLAVTYINAVQVFNKPVVVALFISILWLVLSKGKEKFFHFSLNTLLPLIFVASYPLIWFFVIRNHSAIHWWWAHKDLVISIFSALSWLAI